MLGDIFDAIKDIANGIERVIDGLIEIVNSVVTMVKWVLATMNFVSTDFLQFVPSVFIGLALVLVTIYLAKVILGGSNK